MSQYTEEEIYEAIGGVPIKKLRIVERDPQQKYVAIPEGKWWQLSDIFTKLDEFSESQIRLGNLVVGRLDQLIALLGGQVPEAPTETAIKDLTNKIRSDTINCTTLNLATPLYSYSALCKRAIILADPANPVGLNLWIGGADVAPPETGYPMPAGAVYPTTLDSLDKIYYYSTVAGYVIRVIREWWED